MATKMENGSQHYNWKPLTFSSSTLKLLFLIAVWPAVALFIILAGSAGWLGQSVAWLILALSSLAFLLVIWPWLTTPNPVLSISADGLHDRRQTVQPVSWDDIAFVSYASDGINLAVELKPNASTRITWQFPFSVAPKKTSFHVVLSTLNTSGRAPLDECLKGLRARMEMHSAAAASFIKKLGPGGLSSSKMFEFNNAMQNVLLTHPTWEKSPSHDVNVVVTEKGHRLIHAFLDDRLFEQRYPDWDASASTIWRLAELARINDVQEIVIDPGSANELRISSSLFDALNKDRVAELQDN